MAANFMATSRMTILRLFIDSEDLNLVNWQLVDNVTISNSGQADISEAMQLEFDNVEIYLAPYLATILKVELGEISDRKINDELLLGLVEDSLAEDIENCKPILMRLTDGIDYVAILHRNFYQELLEKLANNVKQIKFIQPFPFITRLEQNLWTVYLVGADKFIRVSQYEYYLLDDQEPIPELLEQMLASYEHDSLLIYANDDNVVKAISDKFNLNCKIISELDYGLLNWNLYNEKSKRFNIKLNKDTVTSIVQFGKVAGVFAVIFAFFWFMNLFYLIYQRHKLQTDISGDLAGIITNTDFNPNLISQVDEKLITMEHQKGLYAPSDMVRLFDVFLKSIPSIDNSMIQGIQYSGSQLNVFLNSQYDPSHFANDQGIMLTKRIKSDLTDYKTYQAAQASDNSQNNNGGGVLSNTDANSNSTNNATLQDTAWVISLQLISRMDHFDDSKDN